MSEQPPVRKYIAVWIKNRKNPPRNDGSVTISRTLEWVEFGERRFINNSWRALDSLEKPRARRWLL